VNAKHMYAVKERINATKRTAEQTAAPQARHNVVERTHANAKHENMQLLSNTSTRFSSAQYTCNCGNLKKEMK